MINYNQGTLRHEKYFLGDTLCTDWALALYDTQIQTCQDIIEAFMAAFLTELAQNVICHSWFNEIC